MYGVEQFGNSPLVVTWRYQGEQSGHLVTASRENFEIEPFSTALPTTATVEVFFRWLK